MNKKTLILLALITPFLILGAGCEKQKNNDQINVLQIPTSTTITYYLLNKPAVNTDFCDGNNMNSVGFKTALTQKITTNIIGDLTIEEKIKTTLNLAADAGLFSQTNTRIASTTFAAGVVTMHSANGWAGSSIFYCAWKPFIEKNLEQFGEVKKIEWNTKYEDKIKQKLSFTTQIGQSLQNKSPIKEIKNPNLTLPININAGQIKKYFKMDNILFALVMRNSLNVILSIPTNFTPSFAGVLVANQSDTGWIKFVEIKDIKETDSSKNNPYYLMVDNKKLLLTVVDQNGGGSGEGMMKVFALTETSDWSLVGCYFFGGYNDPGVDGDYFAFSTKFDRQTIQPLKSCNDVQLISTTEKAIGYIKNIYEKNGKNYLDINYIQWLNSEECKSKNIFAPNGFCILDQNTEIRTFEISNDVEIFMQTLSHAADGNYNLNEKINYKKFKNIFTTSQNQTNVPYNIELKNNIIIKITEQYIP